MVCSFLKIETEDQIRNFLSKKNDFKLHKFDLINKKNKYSKLFKKNIMITLPKTILNYNIDGYFAACLKKIK